MEVEGKKGKGKGKRESEREKRNPQSLDQDKVQRQE